MSVLCPICNQPKECKKIGDSIFIACKNPNHVLGEMTILKNNGTSMRDHVYKLSDGSVQFMPYMEGDDAEFRGALAHAFYTSNPLKIHTLMNMFAEIEVNASDNSAREFAVKFQEFMRSANLHEIFMLVMLFGWSFSTQEDVMKIYKKYGYEKPYLWVDGV